MNHPKLEEAIPTTSSNVERHGLLDYYSSSRVDDGHSLHNPMDSAGSEALEESKQIHLDCSVRLSLDLIMERRGIDLTFC